MQHSHDLDDDDEGEHDQQRHDGHVHNPVQAHDRVTAPVAPMLSALAPANSLTIRSAISTKVEMSPSSAAVDTPLVEFVTDETVDTVDTVLTTELIIIQSPFLQITQL